MDKSVVLTKEVSLANTKTSWGQVLTSLQSQADWGFGLWPGLDLGLLRPPVYPTNAHRAIW